MGYVPVKIEILISEDKLMNDFMGCNWEQDPVARGFVHHYERKLGDTKFLITFEDEHSGLSTRLILVDDIAKAWGELVASGAEHCGELIGLDSEDWDACVGTAILQQILYGEEIYG
jgi:hypothetical protein